jgi:hypothetical protein
MAENAERFLKAAQECVHAAYKCVDDSDAVVALLKTAQQWIELAEESCGALLNKNPGEIHALASPLAPN